MVAREAIQPIQEAGMRSSAAETTRLFYIDHLRTALIVLVVLHHVSLVYGASLEGYYYVEPPFTEPGAFRTLLVFALANQAWFMGAFFLLSGYFTPGSFNRKGAGAFLKDRLLRLGIPLLLFYFVLSPISFIGYFLMPPQLTGITRPLSWQVFWEAYPNLTGIGPLWFVAMLLVFSFGYAAFRMLSGGPDPSASDGPEAPGFVGIAIFILALAIASYLMRMVIPLGRSVLQFPTLAYLPQYLSFFVLGTIAARGNWFRKFSGTMGIAGFLAAVAASVLLFPLAFSGELFSIEISAALDNAFGAGTWQSALYALWDSAVAVGMSLALITLFRRFIHGRGSFGRFLSRHSYAVYIIHIPIVVFLTYALRSVDTGSLAKFGLASVIIVPGCFTAAYLLRKIPLAAKVL
jgi:peptidoglycan/LPS O-acetylase OafA/YrhL